MNVGDLIFVDGYFTQDKFLAGRTLAEIERVLGYQKGRLAEGAFFAVLMELPNDFELAAYSNVAGHRFEMPGGLDVAKIKANARQSWDMAGLQRLVKACPHTRHNAGIGLDQQYPPGLGVPQWQSRSKLRARVVDIVTAYPDGRYHPKS